MRQIFSKFYRLILIPFVFGSFVLCHSCVSMGEEESAAPKSVRPMPISEFFKFENIPVPEGYKLDKKKSFVFRNDVLLVAFLTYKGKSKADEVAGFFKEQLPLYGWKLVNIIEYGERVLNFEMDGQTCIITIDRRGKTFELATAPRGQKGVDAPTAPPTPANQAQPAGDTKKMP
ncbi:MAG: hypothetical protein PHE61_07580 [Candidatus Omnitrophica bacterium]|nr:hypothetical protein [Candidatus Omnitrophota bacterium]